MVAGELSNFTVVLHDNPGPGRAWTFHIRSNHSSQASCVIAGSATRCDIPGPVSYNHGDTFAVFADKTSSSSPDKTRVAFKADYEHSP